MRKKIVAAFLLVALLCSGCGSGAETETNPEEQAEAEVEMPIVIAEDIPAEMDGDIELKEELPDRDIAIPDYLKDDEESGQAEDGTVFLSGEEQTEEAGRIAEHIEDSINEVLANKEYYPNVTAISVNPDCTEFNVTLSGREISLYENVLPMSLCIIGNKFQLYQGKDADELMTTVNYIDETSGEVFSSSSSKDIR